MNTKKVSVEKAASTIETTSDTVETNSTSPEQEVSEETIQEREEQRKNKIFPCFCHSAMFSYRNQ